MKVPSTVSMFHTKRIDTTDELKYCAYINDLIKKVATEKGDALKSPSFFGVSYVYHNDRVKCTYQDSDFGNDHFHFEISKYLWNDIPTGIDPATVCDEGFNLVYSFQDSPDRKILMQHIPGEWIEVLKNECS